MFFNVHGEIVERLTFGPGSLIFVIFKTTLLG